MIRKKNKFDFQKIAMKAVGVGGGAIVGEVSNNLLKNMNPMLRGGLKIIAGAVIPEFIPMKDKTMIENIGSGIIASGAIDISKNFISPPAVEGISELDQFDDDDSFVVDDGMEGIEDDYPIFDNKDTPIFGDEDSPIFGNEDSPISGDDDNIVVE